MITTTIKMSKVKGKDVFTNAVWRRPTHEQLNKAYRALAKLKRNE